MLILIDSNGKKLKEHTMNLVETYGNNNVVTKTSQDIIDEMINDITRSYGIRKMINKYSKAGVLVVHNCEDFMNRRYTLEEFSVFLEETEKAGVKIILTIERTFMIVDLKKAHKKHHPREKDRNQFFFYPARNSWLKKREK